MESDLGFPPNDLTHFGIQGFVSGSSAERLAAFHAHRVSRMQLQQGRPSEFRHERLEIYVDKLSPPSPDRTYPTIHLLLQRTPQRGMNAGRFSPDLKDKSDVLNPSGETLAHDSVSIHRNRGLWSDATTLRTLEINGSGWRTLTLLDVFLVCIAVSQQSPSYTLVRQNCWWWSESVGALCEVLVRTHGNTLCAVETRDVVLLAYLNGVNTRLRLPGGVDSATIRATVVAAEATFHELVSCSHISNHMKSTLIWQEPNPCFICFTFKYTTYVEKLNRYRRDREEADEAAAAKDRRVAEAEEAAAAKDKRIAEVEAEAARASQLLAAKEREMADLMVQLKAAQTIRSGPSTLP